MLRVRHVIYLHGFASSPGSSKAQRFAPRARRSGLVTRARISTSRVRNADGDTDARADAARRSTGGRARRACWFQPRRVRRRARGGRDIRNVDRLVLLAPALDFGGNRLRQLGEHGIEEWRRRGKLRFSTTRSTSRAKSDSRCTKSRALRRDRLSRAARRSCSRARAMRQSIRRWSSSGQLTGRP